jgi:hypothetical protein
LYITESVVRENTTFEELKEPEQFEDPGLRLPHGLSIERLFYEDPDLLGYYNFSANYRGVIPIPVSPPNSSITQTTTEGSQGVQISEDDDDADMFHFGSFFAELFGQAWMPLFWTTFLCLV